MIKNGFKEEELLQTLKELDSQTAIDSVLTHGQDITISCQMIRGKLANWSMKQGEKEIKYFEHGKGSGYTAFFDTLKKEISENVMNENIVVLCYSYMDTKKTYDNKFMTHWIVVSPTIPFEIGKDGMPEFPMFDLELTKEQYKLAMESRLALYDEISGDVYPIREVAFSSIGKLLDSAASFKNMAQIPLGSALLLAERFATDMKDLKFIYRNSYEHFKPLIGIAGCRFAQDSEFNFFSQALEKMTDMFGYYKVGNWAITDEMSLANVYISANDGSDKALQHPERFNSFSEYNDFPIYLRLMTSDIPGISASVTAFAQIGKGKVMIKKNSAYHWDSFLKKGGSVSLFSSSEKGQKTVITIKQEIDDFVNSIELLKNTNAICIPVETKKIIDKIKTLIGKKKVQQNVDIIKYVESFIGLTPNGYTFLEEVINATYFKLPTKQDNELSILYKELTDILVETAKQVKRVV